MSRFGILLVIGGFAAITTAAYLVMRGPFTYDLLAADGPALPPRGWQEEWQHRLGEVFLPLLDPGDTEYAPSYQEEIFESIGFGTSKEVVLTKLGEPLGKKTFTEPIVRNSYLDGATVWYYSRHGPRSKSYFVRALVFNDKGRVIQRYWEYHLD